jgi:hypothetical protein
MSKSSNGIISDTESYTAKEIANRIGISEAKAKSYIRANVPYTEPFEGLLIVSGRLFNIAIDAKSEFDTDEQKEKRRQKSGAASRKPKNENEVTAE